MRATCVLLTTLVCLYAVVCPAEGFTVDFTMKKSLGKSAAVEFMATVLAEMDEQEAYPSAIVADFSSSIIANAVDAIINGVTSEVTTSTDGSTITIELTGTASLVAATAIIGAIYAVPSIPFVSTWASITTVKVEYMSLSSALSIYQKANDDDVPGCESATIEGIPDFIVFLLIHYYIFIIVGAVCCCGLICCIVGCLCKRKSAEGGAGAVRYNDLNNNIQQPFFDTRTSQHELHSPSYPVYQNPV